MPNTRRDTAVSRDVDDRVRNTTEIAVRTMRAASRSGPPKSASNSLACQARQEDLGDSFSRTILLLNFQSPHREQVAGVLRFPRLKVVVPEEHGISLVNLKYEYVRQADFILFDLTRLDHDGVWLPLRRICRLRRPDGMPLFVHCFSRVYRGKDFHRMVEGLGPRMDYYAE